MIGSKKRNLIDLLLTRYGVLLLLIAVKFIFQYAMVNPVYELHRDEFLYLDQAFHPAAGYVSVPPFTSWIAALIYLLGDGLFWVRFFPALFGALVIVFIWFIVDEFDGGLHAKILAAVLFIFSVYLRINMLFQPNSFEILVSTIIFYIVIKYVRTGHPRWMLLLSVIAALAIYNKYNVLFLIVGLFVGLLLTPQRWIFAKKEFFIALGVSLILLLPNIIWQIQNHFPVIHHLNALNEKQLVHISSSDFLFGQFKYLMGGVISLVVFVGFFLYKPFRPYRFIGWTFVITIMLYAFAHAKGYYAVGLYPVIFAMGSVYWEKLLKKRAAFIVPILVVLSVIPFLLSVKFFMPMQSPEQIINQKETYQSMGLLTWEDGKIHSLPQDFADMIGWKEMAEKALKAYNTLSLEEKRKTLVLTENYGQAGALNFYNRKQMPEAFAFNTDYIYWIPRLPEIRNILWVGPNPTHDISSLFNKIERIDTVQNPYTREKGTEIYLFLNANDGFTTLFYETIDKRKHFFDIF